MLYLEDYLESIENLPMEMRDRFTELRELDLQVQNNTDKTNKKARDFFRRCQEDMLSENEKQHQFQEILKEYSKIVDVADEKVLLASQSHEIVERYLGKLDNELHKFKLELEADNAGITESLERRSLLLDRAGKADDIRRRSRDQDLSRVPSSSLHSDSPEKTLAALANDASLLGRHRPTTPDFTSSGPGTPGSASDLGLGTSLSRRSGTRIDYDRLSKGFAGDTASVGSTDSTRLSATGLPTSTLSSKLQKRHVRDVDLDGDVEDYDIDPNEPRYCLCNDVSYGEMVACDNADCPIEWFHYSCVDLSSAPRGKWYCPNCTAAMKRRGRKL